jgi:poly(3-hydroxybutyrate) depolymerase
LRHIFLLFLFPVVANAQLCRYSERIFPSFTKTANISYGNAPAITSFYVSENTTTNQNLKLDFFEPNADTATKRALIIFAHSGGFINGTKDNQDMQALCDSFAHRGYVTASLDYRLNFNIFSSSSSERAVWRGVQDASAAVRFFKFNAGLYKIDTTKIFVWGSSAGSFMALGLAYIDDAERPASTFSGFLQPDLGCKDCTGNSYTNTSLVTGIISCWGATKDTAWIQNNNNIPVQLFHGTSDATVPFTEGYPFGLSTIAYVRGSQEINQQLNRTSIYHEFYPVTGLGHEYWGTSNGTFAAGGPNAYWIDIITKAKLFMLGRMGIFSSCGPLPVKLISFTGNVNNEKINLYWNTATELSIKDIMVERSNDGNTFTELTRVSPKGINGNGAIYNTTDPYPYSGINYYRLKIADRDGSFSFSNIVMLKTPVKDLVITGLYPNPVNDWLHVQLQSDKSQAVNLGLFDITGKLLQQKTLQLVAGINNYSIPVSNIARGMYILQFKNGQQGNTVSVKICKN